MVEAAESSITSFPDASHNLKFVIDRSIVRDNIRMLVSRPYLAISFRVSGSQAAKICAPARATCNETKRQFGPTKIDRRTCAAAGERSCSNEAAYVDATRLGEQRQQGNHGGGLQSSVVVLQFPAAVTAIQDKCSHLGGWALMTCIIHVVHTLHPHARMHRIAQVLQWNTNR